MYRLICTLMLCVGILEAGLGGTVRADPGRDAGAKLQSALQLMASGNEEEALVAIEEGLAIAPKHPAQLRLKLLGRRGPVLVRLRDLAGARAAYKEFIAVCPPGADKRDALDALAKLRDVETTVLAITADGPATVYLGTRTLGAFCQAAPSCDKHWLPGQYKVIAERPGFEVWTGRVTVAARTTTRLAITLVEKPSRLTVRVTPPGAHVTVDGEAYTAPATVTAGSHQVVAMLEGHVEAHVEATAHEGKPVELDVALVPLVPVRVEPPGAVLSLDGKPVTLDHGGIAVPPGGGKLVARAEGRIEGSVVIPADRPPGYEAVVVLDPVPPPVVPRPVPGLFTPRRKIAVAVGGLGAVAAAAGVVLGVQSRHAKDDAFALCPSPSSPCERASEADSAYTSGRSRALQADIAFGAAGAAAVAAAVLWLTGAPESPVAVTPRVGPIAGLDLTVRF
jgi:hypothetical protein